MVARLTNEIIDERLIGRNIERLDDYINAHIKMRWKCTFKICNNIWKTTGNKILNGPKTKCPECVIRNTYLTNEEVDRRLEGRNIERLDDYIDNKTKIRWRCKLKICNNIWSAKPQGLLNSESGCPECVIRKMNLTNEEIDRRLIGRNIERLEDYKNAATKMLL